jgi:hypothetical protein
MHEELGLHAEARAYYRSAAEITDFSDGVEAFTGRRPPDEPDSAAAWFANRNA